MDPRTGDIKEFDTRAAAEAKGYTIPVKRPPKPDCKNCYGRGHIGRNDHNEYVPCACVL